MANRYVIIKASELAEIEQKASYQGFNRHDYESLITGLELNPQNRDKRVADLLHEKMEDKQRLKWRDEDILRLTEKIVGLENDNSHYHNTLIYDAVRKWNEVEPLLKTLIRRINYSPCIEVDNVLEWCRKNISKKLTN